MLVIFLGVVVAPRALHQPEPEGHPGDEPARREKYGGADVMIIIIITIIIITTTINNSYYDNSNEG